MTKEDLNKKLQKLDKDELIKLIIETHENLGCVFPYYSERKYYPRISPFSYNQFKHGISRSNTFETKKECKEFCKNISGYLQMIIEYHFDSDLLG